MRYQKSGKTIENFRFPKLYPYRKIMNVINPTHHTGQLTIAQMTPILDEVNMDLRRMEEWNIMQQETFQSEADVNNVHELVRRRTILATEFQALPTYGSADFWHLVEEPQLKLALPLEVLVKCIRFAITQEDSAGKKRSSTGSISVVRNV
jgi:hypothetical protein